MVFLSLRIILPCSHLLIPVYFRMALRLRPNDLKTGVDKLLSLVGLSLWSMAPFEFMQLCSHGVALFLLYSLQTRSQAPWDCMAVARKTLT